MERCCDINNFCFKVSIKYIWINRNNRKKFQNGLEFRIEFKVSKKKIKKLRK